MDNTDFSKLSETEIQRIYDKIEEIDSDYKLEVDLLDGILTIETDGGKQFIINKHNASMQIWLSSPVSGAHHFSYNNVKWVSSGGNELNELFFKEIEKFL
jgi:CyaY protein